MTRINSIHVRNYRALADVRLDLGPIGVLFGPNGAGKSTLLDTMWFVRDCAIRGVEPASASRSHGVGILFDGAADDDQKIEITLRTGEVEYALRFDLTAGRFGLSPGELLTSRSSGGGTRISRLAGRHEAEIYNSLLDYRDSYKLREPDKLSLELYLGYNPDDNEAASLDDLLRHMRLYHSRSFRLHRLKTVGSQSSPGLRLSERGDNAWSVLRNLRDRRRGDDRYDTIIGYMRRAFPFFEDIDIEQTGASSVYASFIEKNRFHPILASGVSDGHLQMLLVLIALFSEGNDKGRDALVLLDEPEISLHPWALAVLAEAIKESATKRRQVLVATHSPVLISQFGRDEIIVADSQAGRTHLRRLSEIEEVQDLLDEYAAGALYMSDTIGTQAPQNRDQARGQAK